MTWSGGTLGWLIGGFHVAGVGGLAVAQASQAAVDAACAARPSLIAGAWPRRASSDCSGAAAEQARGAHSKLLEAIARLSADEPLQPTALSPAAVRRLVSGPSPSRWTERLLAAHDPPLTLAQYLTLHAIARDGVGGSELARRTGVSGPAVSHNEPGEHHHKQADHRRQHCARVT